MNQHLIFFIFYRYFYILQTDWLHKTFPNNLSIITVSFLGFIFLFFIGNALYISSLQYCGGFGGIFNLPVGTKILCSAWKMSSNLFCIGMSSVTYAVILRKRGKLLNSKIGSVHVFSISKEIGNQDPDTNTKDHETESNCSFKFLS